MESLKTRLMRWGLNLFPALAASGGRLTYIADDFSVVKLKLKKCLRTRNYVGTMYGGSMYAAVDGIYMVMLIRLLGKDYEVWDMEGRIRYLKPGRTDLFANFKIDTDELALIRETLAREPKLVREYKVSLTDREVSAEVVKTIYIRKKVDRRPVD